MTVNSFLRVQKRLPDLVAICGNAAEFVIECATAEGHLTAYSVDQAP